MALHGALQAARRTNAHMNVLRAMSRRSSAATQFLASARLGGFAAGGAAAVVWFGPENIRLSSSSFSDSTGKLHEKESRRQPSLAHWATLRRARASALAPGGAAGGGIGPACGAAGGLLGRCGGDEGMAGLIGSIAASAVMSLSKVGWMSCGCG